MHPVQNTGKYLTNRLEFVCPMRPKAPLDGDMLIGSLFVHSLKRKFKLANMSRCLNGDLLDGVLTKFVGLSSLTTFMLGDSTQILTVVVLDMGGATYCFPYC